MRGRQENNMRFIFSVFWVLLKKMAGIGISVMIYGKHTMISCLSVGLVTPGSLDTGNTQEELQQHLGKGALISPPPSLPGEKTSSIEEMERNITPHLSLSFDAYHSC